MLYAIGGFTSLAERPMRDPITLHWFRHHQEPAKYITTTNNNVLFTSDNDVALAAADAATRCNVRSLCVRVDVLSSPLDRSFVNASVE